jgi:hypothetical protein
LPSGVKSCRCPLLWLSIVRRSQSHNKPLVPTRNGEAPLLAAQRERYAS